MGKDQQNPSVITAGRLMRLLGKLALQDPSLITRRGDLLELARSKVHENGYSFVKGKSRSKRFAAPTEESPMTTRAKISSKQGHSN